VRPRLAGCYRAPLLSVECAVSVVRCSHVGNLASMVCDVGGAPGGVISDRCCGSKRAPVLLAYFVMELVGFALFLLVDNQYVQVANAGAVRCSHVIVSNTRSTVCS